MLDDLSSLIEEMLAETGGPLTSAERRAADRTLQDSKGEQSPEEMSDDLV